jgi:hypothetical protein
LTLIGVLLTFAAGEVLGAMFYLVIEASKNRLLGQRPLSYEPLMIPAAGKYCRFCTLHMIIPQNSERHVEPVL